MRILILLIIIPINLFSQQCIVFNNVTNADSIEYCITNSSCHDSCDGVINITVYGDNQPYFFEWGSSSPIANDNQRLNLCAGNYSVTITDVNGDFVDFRSNIISEPSELGIFRNVISPTCFNYSDGSIDITTLGDSPFYWNWSNGFNTEDISNLSSGQYILNTTDSNGCSRIDTFDLINPIEVESSTISDTLSCIGFCDATGIVIPIQGVPPFTFLWDNGQLSDSAINLCYGLYNVTITDFNGCFNTNSVFIENPDSLKLNTIYTDSSCYDICDGEIEISISGGYAPYNIIWQLNGTTIDTSNYIIDNLCPDTYNIIFTDNNDCIENESITLYERDSFIIQSNVINDSCFNSCKGQIEVFLLNPENSPFIYNWSNGLNTPNIISNLCADTFNLALINSRLCRDTFEFIVSEPLPINIDSFSIINNSCFNENNGSISVDLVGGTGQLESNWVGPNFTSNTEDIANLYNGTYTLSIEDFYGCTKDTIFTVLHPDSLYATYSTQNVSCFAYSDGIIDVDIYGGTSPYFITWTNVLSDSTYIDSLIASEYVFVISDSNGCLYLDTAIVNQPDNLILTDSISHVLCKGYNTGQIDINVSGGTGPYSYLWNNSFTTEDLQGISFGNYSVIVTDFNQCSLSDNFIVTEPQFPITSNIIGTNILCYGDATGEANLNVSGGTPPYVFQWNNSEVTQNIYNLLAGNYTVVILDSNGCDTSESIEIIENPEIITSYNTNDVLCFGDSTGQINILSTIGGTSPYQYDFSNGYSHSSVGTLLVNAGQYNAVVSDVNNCSEIIQFSILEPDLITTSVNITNIDCYGNNNGEIDLIPSGGTLDYNFLWNNNETTKDIDNLSPGIYFVQLIDNNGCIHYDTASIVEPDEIVINSSSEDSYCNGQDLGSIDLSVSGGTGNPNFSWNDGSSSEDRFNLFAGTYNVDVSDDRNCIVSETFFISEPPPYYPIFEVDNVLCFGESTGNIDFIISGNTYPYFFSWSNGSVSQNIDNLYSGVYSVNVTDSNGCSEIFETVVYEPENIVISYFVNPASCEENNDGSITTTVSGGTLPYSYFWSNGSENANLFDIQKGFYSLELTDGNSCEYSTENIEVNFDGFDGCIEIPTVFTPNNDGIHDEWSIYGLYNFPDVIVSVHNRWGQKVFYSEGYLSPWDGKNNGIDLPIATYYYVIELRDSGKVFNGTVTIKR